ncbi:peptidoglycan-binding protein [Aureimonas sp. SK2]|uniref:NlpC/P60 family protein n=1 Tax=Aureimonas sp. SK2 TaxID=3015992 RepID=UPI002445113A|nr:peptidoglycan-binding protein [Aureimonas sp. SK2]
MSADFHRWLQQRLNAHGLAVRVDGLFGAETRAALVTFQRQHGLQATGTVTSSTVTELRHDPQTGRDTGPVRAPVRPVWLAELERRKGLHEVRDRSRLMEWLRSDGKTLGDPSKLPWCGDAVQTAIALTLPDEPQVANPYLARNWLDFGKPTTARLGAVLVFWRGKRHGTAGHVGLYVGEDATTFSVLGGNQDNALIVSPLDKGRCLGARWPLTDASHTQTVRLAAQAPLSTNEA